MNERDPPVTADRSRLMSKVRQKHTAPERLVRSTLQRAGYRFRLHRRDLPGCPDLVLPKHRLALFVHGCFWHRHPDCRRTTTPKTRTEFWLEKFRRNVERDAATLDALELAGWRTVIIWECEAGDERRVLCAIERATVPIG